MRAGIHVVVVCLVLLLLGTLVVPGVAHMRAAAARSQCVNNLRQIGMGVQNYQSAFGSFPAGTIPNDRLPCDKKLSWLVDTIVFMDQIWLLIDRTAAWDAEPNREPKERIRDDDDEGHSHVEPVGELRLFQCPCHSVSGAPGSPSITHYVGVAGVGPDAAERGLGYPGTGVFGCERRTRAEDIKDGLATTLMVIETTKENGPWTAGGFPTMRGFDPAGGPYLGQGGQFSSNHFMGFGVTSLGPPGVTHAAFADGSVRGLAESVSPEVLEALATVAGGEHVGALHDD